MRKKFFFLLSQISSLILIKADSNKKSVLVKMTAFICFYYSYLIYRIHV